MVVGCAMIRPSVKQVKRIHNAVTILTAVLCGLLFAVDYVMQKKALPLNCLQGFLELIESTYITKALQVHLF